MKAAPILARLQAPVVVVNDAYRLVPHAQMLYACDAAWWHHHRGALDFLGERWSSNGLPARVRHNDKSDCAALWGLRLIYGKDGEGFSLEPDCIHYGGNSGFQAVNLAILMGARNIILAGFDMHMENGRHFFGDHPKPLRNLRNFSKCIAAFDRAAKTLPPQIQIRNATPGSALRCFPEVDLHDALSAPAYA